MSDTARALRDLDARTLRAPWFLYQSLRGKGPVVHVPALQGWMITQHAHAVTVLRDTATWSSASVDGPLPDEHDRWLAELNDEEPDLRELLEVPLQTLLALDPPAHDRLRKVLTRNLSAVQIQGLAPIVDVVVADLAPELITGEPVDAVVTFAEKLPMRVVGTLLGLPAPEQGEWRALAARANPSNPHLEDKGQLRDRLTGELELMQRFCGLLSSPASALADDLCGAVQNGELTLREAAGLCREILVAGTESTGDLLASLLLTLARDAPVLEAIRDDPKAQARFVEEILRLESPFTGFWRRATNDTTLCHVAIPRNGLLMIPFGLLNRDPDTFVDPDSTRLNRPQPRRHLAFGNGIHFCAGAPLTRLQAERALAGLLPHIQSIELLAAEHELAYRPSIQSRGLSALPLRITRRSRHQSTFGALAGRAMRPLYPTFIRLVRSAGR